jgi:REP element-mobilizing transposase RayT
MPYWRLFYHIVWGTKKREPLILPEFESDLHNVVAAKASDLGAFAYAVGGIGDHVHLVASVPPRISLSDFVGQVKGNSSHWVNHQLSEISHFAWQSEYGIVSFGGRQLDFVVKYVKNQHQHHADRTAVSFLEYVGPRKTSTSKPSD